MASLFTQRSARRSNQTLPQPTPSSANTDLSRHTSLQSHSSWSPGGLPQRLLPPQNPRPHTVTPEQFTSLSQQFSTLHADLTTQASLLLGEILALQQTLPVVRLSETSTNLDITAFLQALLHGKLSSALTPPVPSQHEETPKPPRPIRALSREIQACLSKNDYFAAIGTAIDDLRPSAKGDSPDAEQETRDRMDLLRSAMPEGETYEQFWADVAMHLDHEFSVSAEAGYVNSTTFKSGVGVGEIPRERFLATSDGFAWDVEELVGEIVRGKGEFKNPVTGRVFEGGDVELIRRHPLGRGVDEAVLALQREQGQMEGKAEMDGQEKAGMDGLGKGEERWEAKLSAQWARQMHENIREKAEKERKLSGLMSGFGRLKLEVTSPTTAAVELPATTAVRSDDVPSKTASPFIPGAFPDYTTLAELPGSNEHDNIKKEEEGNKANAGEPDYKSFAWYNKYFHSMYGQH
ncbi:hypothetical protein QC763_310115 [Podospora pseudopauciseta]|uniref:BSD domain-containing protein n=1 Tax=Podospora pseudopauciseta TaxID=2093780 RepID=A0ABR0HHP2_9PEZI|nr:hypothetical protein QC763_310115 [Podospora pseudopauciseta]